jgi:FlaA1/EpsC-like NDP-sugar epimerase
MFTYALAPDCSAASLHCICAAVFMVWEKEGLLPMTFENRGFHRPKDTKKFVRVLLLLCADIIVVHLCAFSALFCRYELRFHMLKSSGFLPELFRMVPVLTCVTIVFFALFQLYNSLWAHAGVQEALLVLSASVCSTGFATLALYLDWFVLPRSFPVLYFLFLLIATVSVRFSYRILRRVSTLFRNPSQCRTLLIGAGAAGVAVLREFRTSQFSKNHIVCIIDDDAGKHGRRLMGVPVVGDRNDIPAAVEKYRVSEIVLAIPTLSVQAKKDIWEICRTTRCKFKQLPGLYQLANGDVSIQQIREIQIEDLLQRDVVSVDMSGISSRIRDKVVLVTGGGGSIGSELCRQLASHNPAHLIIFDIYENNAYAIQQELKFKYPDLHLTTLIGSVRDYNRIYSVMQTYHPELVYHAAAHKHVPLMEDAPLEAIKNNVFGTYNTARAAAATGVRHFVLISTDKAVNPTNVMGASKRMCEMVIQMMDETTDTDFAAVRFGNVLGSNGSVIPLFREQIRRGGPVTVTHPDITRFFMTIPEAVSLVLQAGAFAHGGEIFVLDMGKPVKIDDLARNMIRLSGFEPDVDMPVVYTGLRPGEKLYEELLMNEEGLTKTANDLIYVGHRTDFDRVRFAEGLDELRQLPEEVDHDTVRHLIHDIVPTYVMPKQAVLPH